MTTQTRGYLWGGSAHPFSTAPYNIDEVFQFFASGKVAFVLARVRILPLGLGMWIYQMG